MPELTEKQQLEMIVTLFVAKGMGKNVERDLAEFKDLIAACGLKHDPALWAELARKI
jgi:hypothetical protein